MITPELGKHPQWAAEYLEGLEWEARRRELATLEQKLPGVQRIFKQLISGLPSPNRSAHEFPVSAVVVRKGADNKLEVVSTTQNQVNAKGDSTAHAEIEALKEAEVKTGDKHLDGLFLLSTMEPCVMCCAAAVHTEVEGVIYGASHTDVEGTHALVGEEYKPWRISPDSFDADAYLSESGLFVVGGLMKDDVLGAIKRTTGSWQRYYTDPDA